MFERWYCVLVCVLRTAGRGLAPRFTSRGGFVITLGAHKVFQKCLTTAKCCNMQLFFGGVLLYGGFTVGLRWCVCLVIDDAALATPQPRHQRKKNWGWPNGDNGLLNIFARFSRIGRNCGLALSLSLQASSRWARKSEMKTCRTGSMLQCAGGDRGGLVVIAEGVVVAGL